MSNLKIFFGNLWLDLNFKTTSEGGAVNVIGQNIFPHFPMKNFLVPFCWLHSLLSSRMFIYILELIYLFIWISIIILAVLINLLVAPIIALLLGRRAISKLFSYTANTIATIMTIEFEWKVQGKKILFYGDKLPLHQNAIVICNHLSVLDWLVLFSLARRKGRLGVTKFLIKDSVKWIPGVGWGLHMLNYVFLKRDWVNAGFTQNRNRTSLCCNNFMICFDKFQMKDKITIEKAFHQLKESQLPFWLIIFPEGFNLPFISTLTFSYWLEHQHNFLLGTRRSKKKLEESQRYEELHNLPRFRNLLFPRTKGFVGVVKGLRFVVNSCSVMSVSFSFVLCTFHIVLFYKQNSFKFSYFDRDIVTYVYDITIQYDGSDGAPTIADLTLGTIPTPHLHVKKYPVNEIPNDDREIANWLLDRWKEKEELMEYWEKNKHFPNPLKESNVFPSMKLVWKTKTALFFLLLNWHRGN